MTIRMAQYGTKHGHVVGKLLAMLRHPDVEVAGVYEPDPVRRAALQTEDGPFRGVHWFDAPDQLLSDPTIAAVAAEGANHESLDQAEAIVLAGKHLWYDKPAGENWPQWQRVVAAAEAQRTIIQMGYMLRYHTGFRQMTDWARDGLLGQLYAVRAHMSTWLSREQLEAVAVHPGGVFYDLAGHMLDPILWLLGRPLRVHAFLRSDSGHVAGCTDNGLAVLDFENAMAFVDIAAMEPPPMARRFEIYGTRGSAILLEPFEPGTGIRLCLATAAAGFSAGDQLVAVPGQTRQALYERELAAFLGTIRGEEPPDRPLPHELLVQETLLRATHGLA